jgi:hypothetical protein
MTKSLIQQAYDGLVKQGRQATQGDSCRYRTKSGDKCAVGQLIKDEYYHKSLEGQTLGYASIRSAVEKSINREMSEEEFNDLKELQRLHDRAPTSQDEFVPWLNAKIKDSSLKIKVTE